MTEPEKNKERTAILEESLFSQTLFAVRTAIEDNFTELRVSDKSEVHDVGLSRLKVIVRRQDSSMAEVFLGRYV